MDSCGQSLGLSLESGSGPNQPGVLQKSTEALPSPDLSLPLSLWTVPLSSVNRPNQCPRMIFRPPAHPADCWLVKPRLSRLVSSGYTRVRTFTVVATVPSVLLTKVRKR